MTAWQPGTSRQSTAQVPRKIPGGPVVKVMATVYRARIWRQVDGQRVPAWDVCPHNHAKRATADACAGKAARRLNRLAVRDHEPWPAEGKLRSVPLGFTVGTDERKVAPRCFPITGICQPCGRPIVLADPDGTWAHDDPTP